MTLQPQILNNSAPIDDVSGQAATGNGNKFYLAAISSAPKIPYRGFCAQRPNPPKQTYLLSR